ncbi:MAG: uracil phosphoribosyltransferase [Candidatus Woesearchaeota archaeon]
MEQRHFLVESPLLSRLIAEMRDKKLQRDSHRFRSNSREIGYLLAYEIEKNERFDQERAIIETVNGAAEHYFRTEEPLIVNILRAADPLVQGTLEVFRNSPVAFLDMKRKEGTYDLAGKKIEVVLQYASVPLDNLEGKTLLVPDIMLATGSSQIGSYEYLAKRYGKPARTIISSIISTQQGIENVLEMIPNSKVYVAAIDSTLDERAYIVPGLGDAGDLCYNGGNPLLKLK